MSAKEMEKRLLCNKKGISTIVSSLLMIMLVIISVAIIWSAVISLINSQTGGTISCSKIYGKITINRMYTCYNSSSQEIKFSIRVGDINIDKVLVAISSEGATKSFKISNDKQRIDNLVNYTGGEMISLPEKNGGLTYFYKNITKPDLIELAPIIEEKQCEVTDSVSEIDDCNIFA